MDENLVFDLLLPMDRQGLLKSMWDNKGHYPPSDSVEETFEILVMMEASVWKIFDAVPSHFKADVHHRDEEDTDTHSFKNAIEILLECGPNNFNQGKHTDDRNGEDDGEEGKYLLDGDEKDSLIKALKELEDLLDEHLDTGENDEGENDGATQQQASETTIELATTLSNQMRPEGNRISDSGGLSSRDAGDPTGNTRIFVKQSCSDDTMESTHLNAKSHQSTGNYLNYVEEDYLDFIYDDRAPDYEDNLPDVTRQIYEHNGNQELRYKTSFEVHIYEGMHRSPFHVGEDGESDFEF